MSQSSLNSLVEDYKKEVSKCATLQERNVVARSYSLRYRFSQVPFDFVHTIGA